MRKYVYAILGVLIGVFLFVQPLPSITSVQASCAPANCIPGREVDRRFFVKVIERLNNVPLSDFALEALMAWKPYENTSACWNPLATTWKMEVVCYFNCLKRDAAGNCIVGVQNYQNEDMGVRATANTLNLSYYDAIRKMLRREAFEREKLRSALATWGTCSGSGCDPLLNQWQKLWNKYNDPLAGYVFCANETQRCNFSGTRDVAYGANGRFNFKYGVSNGIDCNNTVFGDPAPGVVKACYVKISNSCNPAPGQVALFVDANYSGRCILKGIGNYSNSPYAVN